LSDSKDEKPKGKAFGGAGNPKRTIELRNKAEGNNITYADGAHNPNRTIENRTPTTKGEAHNYTRVIDIRNQNDTTHVAMYNPVTKKITLDGKEVKEL